MARKPLEDEDLSEAILEEMEEMASRAYQGAEADVTLFSCGKDDDEFGYEVSVDDEVVRVDDGYGSLLDTMVEFEAWAKRRARTRKDDPADEPEQPDDAED